MFFETILPSYFIPTDFNHFEHLKLLPPLELNIPYENSSKLSLYTENPQFPRTLSSVFSRSTDAESYTSESNVTYDSTFCHDPDDIPAPTANRLCSLIQTKYSSQSDDVGIPPLVCSSTQTDCANQDCSSSASLVSSWTQTDRSIQQDCLSSSALVGSSTQTDSTEEKRDEVLQHLNASATIKQLKDAVQTQDEKFNRVNQQLAALTAILQKATELILNYSQAHAHVPDDHLLENNGHSEHSIGKPQCVNNKADKSTNSRPDSRTAMSGVELQSLSQVIMKFDGDRGRFQNFKYRFNTIVDSMKLPDADKALLLFVSLEDSVLDLIGDITSDGCIDYQKLWLALEEEFAPLQQGLFSHIAELSTIRSMPQCDSSKTLKDLHTFVKKHYVALKKIGMSSEVEGFTIPIFSKLSGTPSEQVCDLMRQSDGQQIVPQILEIIKDEVDSLELQELAASLHDNAMAEGDIYHPTKDSSQSCYKVTASPRGCLKQHKSQQQTICIFCNGNDHISSMCQYYSDPSYYKQILYQRFLCYNCFDYGHKSYACPDSKQCNLCNDDRKHAEVLCSRNFS